MLLGATQKSAGGRVAEVGTLKRLLTRACLKNLTASQNKAVLEWFTDEADGGAWLIITCRPSTYRRHLAGELASPR